jgi:hypothetical protein
MIDPLQHKLLPNKSTNLVGTKRPLQAGNPSVGMLFHRPLAENQLGSRKPD